MNMLLNFSSSSFVAVQGSLQPGKQREGPEEMIWWQGSTWVYLQIPLCSNKRPVYLFIAYTFCAPGPSNLVYKCQTYEQGKGCKSTVKPRLHHQKNKCYQQFLPLSEAVQV